MKTHCLRQAVPNDSQGIRKSRQEPGIPGGLCAHQPAHSLIQPLDLWAPATPRSLTIRAISGFGAALIFVEVDGSGQVGHGQCDVVEAQKRWSPPGSCCLEYTRDRDGGQENGECDRQVDELTRLSAMGGRPSGRWPRALGSQERIWSVLGQRMEC